MSEYEEILRKAFIPGGNIIATPDHYCEDIVEDLEEQGIYRPHAENARLLRSLMLDYIELGREIMEARKKKVMDSYLARHPEMSVKVNSMKREGKTDKELWNAFRKEVLK